MTTSVMRKYEGLFLVDSALATAEYDRVLAAIQTVLDRAKAEVSSLKKWDDRRLCYEVKGCTRGTYFLCNFNAMPGMIAALERDVQISEDILRVMVLNAEEIPSEILDSPTPLERGIKADQESTEGSEREDVETADFDIVEDIKD